ncbi:MAG: hypothetical protein VXV85_07835, partial [Candidatus Thermoplasmatota archaeon]|nr:hypothetical protein [Candidatus Thermoplasmatota archaeon]
SLWWWRGDFLSFFPFGRGDLSLSLSLSLAFWGYALVVVVGSYPLSFPFGGGGLSLSLSLPPSGVMISLSLWRDALVGGRGISSFFSFTFRGDGPSLSLSLSARRSVRNPLGNPCRNPCRNPFRNPSRNPCRNPFRNPSRNPSRNPFRNLLGKRISTRSKAEVAIQTFFVWVVEPIPEAAIQISPVYD